MEKSSRTLLELNQVNLTEGKQDRLLNINISISFGEKIALLGRSGSGKSTLISIANGSITPTKGEVKWEGNSIDLIKRKQKANIATMWQELRLIDELNVQQNINVGALGRKNIFWALRNLLGNIETKRCKTCLNATGLNELFLEYKLCQLSGGQRQRVAIARLIRQQAKLILADEPLLSLDPNTSKQILNLLLNRDNNFPIIIPETCLISLHQPGLVSNFSRVIGIKNGEIVLDIPSEKFGESESELIYRV